MENTLNRRGFLGLLAGGAVSAVTLTNPTVDYLTKRGVQSLWNSEENIVDIYLENQFINGMTLDYPCAIHFKKGVVENCYFRAPVQLAGHDGLFINNYVDVRNWPLAGHGFYLHHQAFRLSVINNEVTYPLGYLGSGIETGA